MTIHDVDIYHCQKCGRVCSCEHEEQIPECCEEEMVRAVAHITYENGPGKARSTDEVIEKSHRLDPSKRK